MNDLIRLYKKIIDDLENEAENIDKDYWRLGYHLMPPVGWLNDPNGLCEFNGEYHVFYQYGPSEVDGGLKFWGHYSSNNFVNWTKHPVAIYPDQVFDLHGVFSGSTFVEDNKMYCYYTGTVKREGYNDNYEIEGMEQNTVLVTSEDGFKFSDKKLLLTNEDYPNMSWHVRDPKVWKDVNDYKMILGARDENSEGCILVYTSDDKENWIYKNTIKAEEKFGYMWECPDLFEICGNKILVTCPQGVPQDGKDIVNIHQCGYFIVDGDITEKDYKLSKFTPLDRGFDFYAPQTFVDSKGRRILIGWLSISDTPFEYPTMEKGWNHCLSIPRELKIKDNKVIQCPIKELEQLRDLKVEFIVKNEELIFLDNNSVENIQEDKYELVINFNDVPEELKINLRGDIDLVYLRAESTFTLSFGESGYGRDNRRVVLDKLNNLRVFMDTSSIEIFINHGEEVFTSRVFPNKENKNIEIKGKELDANCELYKLNQFIIN